MPQICRICIHPELSAINAELSGLWQRSLRSIGAAYGVSKDSLFRHSREHIGVVEGPGDPEIGAEDVAPADEPRQGCGYPQPEKSEDARQIAEQENGAAEPAAEDTRLSEWERIFASFKARWPSVAQ